jgi:hypothetical protein
VQRIKHNSDAARHPRTSCVDISFSFVDSSVTNSSRAIYGYSTVAWRDAQQTQQLNHDDLTNCP